MDTWERKRGYRDLWGKWM